MKLAWLCKNYDDEHYIILFKEPSKWAYDAITPIVFAEIVK